MQVAEKPRFLSRAEVARLAGVSIFTIRSWERSGRIPRGLRITKRTIRWEAAEVEAALMGAGLVAAG